MKKVFSLITCFFFLGFNPLMAAVPNTGSAFILPEYSKKISLDFKNADLRDVLKVFSRQIGVNFILSDKVKDTYITVFLDKVPTEEAFEKILQANDLVYQYDAAANIFFVEPKSEDKEIVTHVYTLKHATVPTSKLETTFSITGSAASGADDGLLGALKAVLSEKGKIVTDPRTNSLIITDIEDVFSEVEKTITRLDVPVAQVFIQVEMIDTTKSAVDALGVKFSGNLYDFGLAGRSYYFPFKDVNVIDKYAGTETYTSSSMTSTFKAALQFLMTRSDSKSVARPRIMTLNNETAQMLIETDELVGVTRTVDENNNETFSAERMKTGVALTVTPQVDILSGDIMLAVDAKFTQASDSAELVSGAKFKDPETRGVKVKMKVRSKDTIIMAGMVRSARTTSMTKIPILGDLPLIGRLFRSKDRNNADRELLIVITPQIVTANGSSFSGNSDPADIMSRESSGPERSRAIDSALDRISSFSGFGRER